MTGRQEDNATCAFCGGPAQQGLATIPFVLGTAVIVVRDVPALVCENCGEPFMSSRATDIVTRLLGRFHALGAELSVVSYAEEEDNALLAR